MNRPPLHALQGFVVAARLRNLSQAAATLNLTVSALSHQMRALEERLGLRLLERSPRGVRLTEDGEHLYRRVAPHLDAIGQALRPYGARQDHVLVISLLPSLANSWLMPRLPGWLAAQPQIELSLRSEVELVDFDRDLGVHAALRFGPGQWPGLRSVPLFHEWLTPVAAPALLERLGALAQAPASLGNPSQPGSAARAQVSPHGALQLSPGAATFDRFPPLSALPLLGDPGGRWDAWFARFGGEPPARYATHFNDSESLHRAAAEGLGVALGRLTLARPLLDAGRLVALSHERLASDFCHCLVWPARSERHRGVALFRDWIVAEAALWRQREGLPAV